MSVTDLLKQARNAIKTAADYPPMAYPPMAAVPKYKPMPTVKKYPPMETTVSKPVINRPTVTNKVAPAVPEPVVPTVKPHTTSVTPSKRGLYDYTIPELYNAIQYAETGSERNPWIRTKHAPKGGSTAYGPVQITGSTISDLVERYPKEFKLLKPYTDKLLRQAKLFATYGKEPYKPGYRKEYDYGGIGLGVPDKREQLLYHKFGQTALWAKIQDLKRAQAKRWNTLSPQKQLELKIQQWRAVPRHEDPAYYNKVINKLKSYVNPS